MIIFEVNSFALTLLMKVLPESLLEANFGSTYTGSLMCEKALSEEFPVTLYSRI